MNRHPSDIDVQLGELIRTHRLRKGKTQEWLAKRTGISYQQVHKHETAQCRITVSRLLEIASALGVDVRELIGELM